MVVLHSKKLWKMIKMWSMGLKPPTRCLRINVCLHLVFYIPLSMNNGFCRLNKLWSSKEHPSSLISTDGHSVESSACKSVDGQTYRWFFRYLYLLFMNLCYHACVSKRTFIVGFYNYNKKTGEHIVSLTT